MPLPVLVHGGDPRSADPFVCPYLRLDAGGGSLVAPFHSPADDHQCAAYGKPKPQSLPQQELVCLQAEHRDCPRYLRGQAATEQAATIRRIPAMPRATVAAVLILILSAAISFGFVIQRGGIELPVVAAAPASSAPVAIVSTPAPSVSPADPATPGPTPADGASQTATDGATATTPPAPSAAPTPTAASTPSATPGPTPTATTAPTPTAEATPSPTPRPSPRPTPHPTATPTSTRYALLTPCSDRKACWVYTVRAGDNLFSIAHYFGQPLSTLYAWNPQYARGTRLRAGDQIRMPAPRR